MQEIFEVYLIICGVLVSTIILAALVCLLLRLGIEIYGRLVGLDTVIKALKEYKSKREKTVKLDVSNAFKRKE